MNSTDPLNSLNNYATITTYSAAGAVLFNVKAPGIPNGNATRYGGRGIAFDGTNVYYTFIVDGGTGDTGTIAIHVCPFNGGALGPDIRTLPNPRGIETAGPPNDYWGMPALCYANGALYVKTPYDQSSYNPPFITSPTIIYKLNPTTGAVLSSVTLTGGTLDSDGDGFTVMADGNFLLNQFDGGNVYQVYDSTTGAYTGTSFTLHKATGATRSGTGAFYDSTSGSYWFSTGNTDDLIIQNDGAGNFLSQIQPADLGAGTAEGLFLFTCPVATVVNFMFDHFGGSHDGSTNLMI